MARSRIRTAVILAGGRGSRFWPYNLVRQKAAFPIANVPIVRRIASDLIEQGIERLVVVTGTGEPSVRAALHGFSVEPRYVRHDGLPGTAAAALAGSDGIDEDYLVIAGDIVTDGANFAALMERFDRERPLAAALVQRLEKERPHDWIVAEVDGDDLSGVVGHSRSGEYRLGGAYAFRNEMSRYLRDNPGILQSVAVGGMPPTEADIGQSLQMALDDGKRVAAAKATGFHVDVDKPWQILEANQAVIRSMGKRTAENVIADSARIHDGADLQGKLVIGENASIGNRVVVRGDLWLGAGARIDNGAILDGPVVVGADCTVRDYCLIGTHSTLGAKGVYGHGAEFSGVALDRVYCFHYCEIWGVAGSAVDFGAATVCANLRFDDGETRWHIKGRAETPTFGANAAYFGDYVRTGVNVIVMPGKRIGAYSVIGPGVVLYDDLPDRQTVTLRQELERRPWGPEQYGW